MRKIFLFILVSMLLVACGTKEDPNAPNNVDTSTQEDDQNDKNQTELEDNTDKEPGGFAFIHNGVSIYMNTDVEPVIDALGESLEYFEAESCAFKGLDKFYIYPGFQITTYPNEGKDFISAVEIMDDSVSTPEGIYLGSTVDDMISAYGDDYVESQGLYTYTLDDSNLQFITMEDEIIAINYLAIVEGLE